MAPPALSIRVLGELDVRLDGNPLPALEAARAESLLTYLLLHRDAPQPRQRLAFLLWPDSTEAQARTNLRHLLHTLRRARPELERFLDITPRTLRWRVEECLRLDVADFEAALADGGLAALREAVALYRGDLLAGSYDEWLLEQRERLRQLHVEGLERLCSLLEQRGLHAEAVGHAEALLRSDPLREQTYRLLMRLHDAHGDRARALRVYHACTATLERELGLEPSEPTRLAYEALLPARDVVSDRLGGLALVGRAGERARLSELWQQSERGRAQLVLVTGEPGVGKTRLVEELGSWCARRGALTAEARSYPAEGSLAYEPVATWLRSEPIAARRDRLDRGHLSELARVLPELSDAPPDDHAPAQRRRLFEALAGATLAADAPLLLVADDAHWADRETLQFLHYLLRSRPDARLLVAATARREEIDAPHPLDELMSALAALGRGTELALDRLTRDETAALAERFGGRPLPRAEAERLFAESEGNALFVVETLRAGPLTARVRAVLESRLDQLSEPARALVGVAATIGREFGSDLLAVAAGTAEQPLVAGLDELWRRRIIRERGAAAYDFSHDKLREAAYRALGPAVRRHHHLRIAEALARLDPGDPGLAAWHYDRAGAAREAVPSYASAAERAQRMHASVEAIRLLERALELSRALPRTAERDRQELALLTALLAPMSTAEGFASERLHEIQRRVHDLAGEPESPLLRSMALTSLSHGRFGDAQRAGSRLLAHGERDGDAVLLVEGHYVLGISAFWQGRLQAAREHFEAAVERYRAEHHDTHVLRYGLDPGVVCLSRLANTLWFLGRPQAARRARDDAAALADRLRHPPSGATAVVFAALLALELRDDEAIRRHASVLGAWTDDDLELKAVLALAGALGGYVEALDGRPDAGLARVQAVLTSLQEADPAPGNRAALTRVLLELASLAGDARAGLAAADGALGPGLWAAETRRRRAEFLAELGAGDDEVEAELRRALEIASRQGARSLELRTAASLVRLRPSPESRERLATILDALPEARATPDGADADALLMSAVTPIE